MLTTAFLKDAVWRAFRTFCQALAGLLVTTHISNAFNAPWIDLVGASLLAGLTSLLMSIDRGTVTTAPVPSEAPAPQVEAAFVTPITCGDKLK